MVAGWPLVLVRRFQSRSRLCFVAPLSKAHRLFFAVDVYISITGAAPCGTTDVTGDTL